MNRIKKFQSNNSKMVHAANRQRNRTSEFSLLLLC